MGIARLRRRFGHVGPRSGLRSSSGVPSTQSSPRTSSAAGSTPTTSTMLVPIGLGRIGERRVKVARVAPSFFGLWRSRSRRERCSQVSTSSFAPGAMPSIAGAKRASSSIRQTGPRRSDQRGAPGDGGDRPGSPAPSERVRAVRTETIWAASAPAQRPAKAITPQEWLQHRREFARLPSQAGENLATAHASNGLKTQKSRELPRCSRMPSQRGPVRSARAVRAHAPGRCCLRARGDAPAPRWAAPSAAAPPAGARERHPS